MIEAGCMENPHVDAVFFSHCTPGYPLGQIKARLGSVSAASNGFSVTFRGKGCHGASPHKGIDPIVAACQTVTALQTIRSRRISVAEPAVITVGSIHAGSASNIVPDEAVIAGTIRTMNPQTRQQVLEDFKQVVNGMAAAMNVEVDILIKEGYAATVNNEEMVELVRSAGAKVVGKENVRTKPEIAMGAEDFAYFCEAAPGCYYSFGVASDKYTYAPGHNPKFVVDPDALPYGAAMYAQIATDFLNG